MTHDNSTIRMREWRAPNAHRIDAWKRTLVAANLTQAQDIQSDVPNINHTAEWQRTEQLVGVLFMRLCDKHTGNAEWANPGLNVRTDGSGELLLDGKRVLFFSTLDEGVSLLRAQLAAPRAMPAYRKCIAYDDITHDWAMYIDGEIVGYRDTHRAAERALDDLVYGVLTHLFESTYEDV